MHRYDRRTLNSAKALEALGAVGALPHKGLGLMEGGPFHLPRTLACAVRTASNSNTQKTYTPHRHSATKSNTPKQKDRPPSNWGSLSIKAICQLRRECPACRSPLGLRRGLSQSDSCLPCWEIITSHRLTWKCTDPCRKTAFLLERGCEHFRVS